MSIILRSSPTIVRFEFDTSIFGGTTVYTGSTIQDDEGNIYEYVLATYSLQGGDPSPTYPDSSIYPIAFESVEPGVVVNPNATFTVLNFVLDGDDFGTVQPPIVNEINYIELIEQGEIVQSDAELIDYKAEVPEKLAKEYSESPNLIAYIKALLTEACVLEEIFCTLIEKQNIEYAEGQTLDYIGELVGISRDFVSSTYGTNGDSDYRTLIRAKIASNNSATTINEIIDSIKFVFPDVNPVVVEGNLYYQWYSDRQFNSLELSIINNAGVILKTAGVQGVYAGVYTPFQPGVSAGNFAFFGNSIGRGFDVGEFI